MRRGKCALSCLIINMNSGIYVNKIKLKAFANDICVKQYYSLLNQSNVLHQQNNIWRIYQIFLYAVTHTYCGGLSIRLKTQLLGNINEMRCPWNTSNLNKLWMIINYDMLLDKN